MQSFRLLGREHSKGNRFTVLEPNPRIALGITAGSSRAIKKKTEPNEDCVAWYQSKNLEMALLADAHFGANASHVALPSFEAFWNTSHGALEKRLFHFHFHLDEQLNDQGGSSATTLLTTAVHHNRLYWVSSGDSLLYLLRDGVLKQLNQLHHGMYLGPPDRIADRLADALNELRAANQERLITFLLGLTYFSYYLTQKKLEREKARSLYAILQESLGEGLPYSFEELMKPWHEAHILCAHHLPIWGSAQLRPGDRILLASDGIDEGVSGLSLEGLNTLMAGSSAPKQQVEEILQNVLKGGGGDNCSVLLRQF